MKIEKTIEYKARLVITPERLCELESIILKYCDKVDYKVKTKGKTEITFDNREELLEYDNFKNEKIVSLRINAYSRDWKNTIDVNVVPYYRMHRETATCSYKLTDKTKETVFVKDINSFFQKATEAQNSYLICRLATFFAFFMLSAFFGNLVLNENPTTANVVYFCLAVAYTFGFLFIPIKRFWEMVFPPALFPWGEEKKHYESIKHIRDNLFWALLVPEIFGILKLITKALNLYILHK